MSSQQKNYQPPRKILLRSRTQVQRVCIKRCYPISIEFKIEDVGNIEKHFFKKFAAFMSKRVCKMKNAPIKETLKQINLVKNMRGLQISPEDAARYITEITRRFSRLNHLAILDETDSFSPLRIKKKVHPMRLLKSFVYDHEFCLEFLRCARYAKSIMIRKTSIDFNHLKRLQRLQSIYVIMKTKYLSLPEDDKTFTKRLGDTLLKLPALNKVVIEQEIDPENHPFTFLNLSKVLEGKAKVDLVADFVDVSSQRNKDMNVEKIVKTISDLSIRNVYVNYVGIIKALKRFGRSFYAPIHVRKELYLRFIRTILETSFENVQFKPIVHSSYIDQDLKDILLESMKPHTNMKLPGITLIYSLDMIEYKSLDLMLDLYNHSIPCYELVIVSTTNLRRGLPEMLEAHYSAVLAKVQKFKAEFSLQISARNLAILSTLLQIITPKVNLSLLKSLNIQIIEPIVKANLKSIGKLLSKSLICNAIRKLEIDLSQKEAPKSEDLFEFLSAILQGSSHIKKLVLSYHNTLEHCEGLKDVFEQLRRRYFRVDSQYEINKERACFD